MSPIEVMARAMQIKNRPKDDYRNRDYREADEDASFSHYVALATAALLALSQMEPTPGMFDAGVMALVAHDLDRFTHEEIVAWVWKDMLAAAVKERE